MTQFCKAVIRYCNKTNLNINTIYIVGFDSFQGLPVPKHEADEHVDWYKGKFSYSKDFVMKKIEETGFPLNNVLLIEGFYEDSLNEENFLKISHLVPSIITIDVDYYSSAKMALEFIAPILKSGTFFYFDDYWSFHGHPQMGEIRAINEFNGKYGYLTPYNYINPLRNCTFIYSSLEWEHKSK